MHTFRLVFISLISQKTQIGRKNIEFLTNGIEGLIQPDVSMLAWPLSRRACRLEAPVLIEGKDVRWSREGEDGRKKSWFRRARNFALASARGEYATLRLPGVATRGRGEMQGGKRRNKERGTYVVNCGGHGGSWERSGWVLIIALYNKRWSWTLHSHSFPTFGVPGGKSISGAHAQQAQSRVWVYISGINCLNLSLYSNPAKMAISPFSRWSRRAVRRLS